MKEVNCFVVIENVSILVELGCKDVVLLNVISDLFVLGRLLVGVVIYIWIIFLFGSLFLLFMVVLIVNLVGFLDGFIVILLMLKLVYDKL